MSINSKKTSIQEIEPGTENELIKAEVKKLTRLGSYSVEEQEADQDAEHFVEKYLKETAIDKEAGKLSEQDQGSVNSEFWKNVSTIQDRGEIEKFWIEQFREAEEGVADLFSQDVNDDVLKLKEDVEDVDFIHLSVQYTNSHRALKELGKETVLNQELIKYWLFAYRKFFWRANNLGMTLGAYGANQEIKLALMKMYEEDFKPYEWVRYFIIMTLSFNHNFTDKELRQVFFKWLKEENSDLVKINLYRLLFKHAKSQQFASSLKKELKSESSKELKLMITDFNRSSHQKDIDMVEFINTIGL